MFVEQRTKSLLTSTLHNFHSTSVLLGMPTSQAQFGFASTRFTQLRNRSAMNLNERSRWVAHLNSHSAARTVTRFIEDRRAATAVEFGLVSLPFLALIGGILQVAFQIWAAQNLDYTLHEATRSLLTGQFQSANQGQTDPAVLLSNLKTQMCGTSNAALVSIARLPNSMSRSERPSRPACHRAPLIQLQRIGVRTSARTIAVPRPDRSLSSRQL